MRRGLDADLVIAGAGCAGLSLAMHLDRLGAGDLEMLLLDPRQSHTDDRIWCYWGLVDHPFEAAVRKTWHRWKIATASGETVRGSPQLPYRCLPAGAFYDIALDRLSGRPNVRVCPGVAVEGFRDAGSSVVARTSDGEVRCRLAFDSRPRRRAEPPRAGHVDWVQHFVGLEVCTDGPVFDPEVVTLMDFRIARGDDIRFMYVLPFDRRRALVEDTFFGGARRPVTEHLDSIAAYLTDRLGASSWTEVRREVGAIPMSTVPAAVPESDRVTDIGTRAGLARPSTGYAFLAIQRHSEALAGWVARHGVQRPVPRRRAYGRATEFLDRVFLGYLEREPAAAPDLFGRMFAGVAPDRMARFLFDGGSPLDRAAVMRSLPAVPLIRQAMRGAGESMRAAARSHR